MMKNFGSAWKYGVILESSASGKGFSPSSEEDPNDLRSLTLPKD